MPSVNQIKGRLREDQALKYFQSKKYKLISRNTKIQNTEIDLLLKKDETYFIIEVKSKNIWREQNPVSYKQLARLKKAAHILNETSTGSTRLLAAFVDSKGQVEVYPLDEDWEDPPII